MTKPPKSPSPYPSVDGVARSQEARGLAEVYGRTAVIAAIRTIIDAHRAGHGDAKHGSLSEGQVARESAHLLQRRATPQLRRMFNLTGVVLHTNLGRAPLSEAAVAHASMVMRHAANLEFDLDTGERGERDSLVEGMLTELCGTEAATVVNNNAAAVLLVLAALAAEREVVLSRGEMIEIGGAFRMPDVMRSANVRLVEVGTTNRTHKEDYESAIGPNTAALMKVHTSNYRVVGFTADVSDRDVGAIAAQHNIPFVVDLGAGSLIDLSVYGLPKEPLVSETIAAGADVVTFSGDKLLGGPQAGLIVGKKAFIDRIRRHPLKRALRVSKITLAALEATLIAYRRPDFMVQEIPTLRLLTRPLAELEALADRLLPALSGALGGGWTVEKTPTSSRVGSGSLPLDVIPSIALAIRAADGRSGKALSGMAARLRGLPVPVIGRISDEQLFLDLRCLESEADFLEQIEHLARHG